MRHHFSIVFLLVSVITISGRDVDLQSVLKLAIENNKEIEIAREELKTADVNVKEAWATALPSLNAGVNYNRNFNQTFFYVNGADFGRFSFTFNNEYNLSATLNQTIYSFGKVGNALKIAYDYKQFARHQFNYQKQSVLAEVKRAFYRVLLSKKILEVSKDSEESARSNYENTKMRYESGTVSEFELLQAEVRWQNAVPDTIESAKNYSLSLNNLKSLLNLPIDEPLTVNGTLDEIERLPAPAEFQRVLESRPDYQALQLELSMRKKNINLEFANHLPTLLGNLTYTYSALSDEFMLENENKNLVLGISLNIPIFSGGATSARVQSARIEANKAKIRISQQEDRIRIELENIRLRLKEAKEKIVAAEKNVTTAERAFEIAGIRVKNGLATQLELKDSRVFLDQALLRFYEATYDYLDAYFDWEITSGTAFINQKNL